VRRARFMRGSSSRALLRAPPGGGQVSGVPYRAPPFTSSG
jgi:hypothetical protein